MMIFLKQLRYECIILLQTTKLVTFLGSIVPPKEFSDKQPHIPSCEYHEFFQRDYCGDGGKHAEQWSILKAEMDEVSCWNCALVIASQPHEKRMFPTVSHFHNPYSTIFPSSSFPQNSFTKKKKKHFSVVKSQTTLTWIETMTRSKVTH